MEAPTHTINNLFAQLGLPPDQASVEHFIKAHSSLPAEVALADAPFWTSAQASFLREELLNDADWVEIIEELNARLHLSG
jgi:hypothetical protein